MASSDNLKTALVAAWQENHWCYSEDFLKALGVNHSEAARVIQKWWGNKEVWLNLLATNIGKAIGIRVALETELSSDWSAKVDGWIDATYADVTAGMTTPPAPALLFTKATVLVCKVMGSGESTLTKGTGNQLKCDECGKSYPKWREQCPNCAQALEAAEKQRLAEAKAAEWRGLTPAPIADVPWQSALRMKHCHGGSGGVFLLKLPTGGICVQASDWAPGEIFAQRLSIALGVRCASSRVVSSAVKKPIERLQYAWDDVATQPLGGFLEQRRRHLGLEQHEWNGGLHVTDVEGHEVLHYNFDQLRENQYPVTIQHPAGDGVQSEGALIRRALQTAEAEKEDISLAKLLKRTFCLPVQEYIDGLVMMGMPAHEYLKTLSGSDPTWQLLGRLMAFDMLINNFDRLPLAWSNDGNLGNLMLGASQGLVVGIDQCVSPIKHPAGLQAYLDRVKLAVAEANGTSRPAKGRFQIVKEAIYVNTAINLGEEEMVGMRAGVVAFMTELAAMSVSGELDEKLHCVSRYLAEVAAELPARLEEGGLHNGPPPVNEFCDLVRKAVIAGQEALAGTGP